MEETAILSRWAIDRNLELDPEAEARQLAGAALVAKGKNLARARDIEGAIAQFQKALELNPSLDIDPEEEARRLAAQGLVAEGERLVRWGKVKEAIAAFEKAQKFDPTLEISARSWSTLGWYGSLWGYVADVMYACEKAVELEPENGAYYDTRGIARALTGDYKGAIEDFEFYIKWVGDKRLDRRPEHRQWFRQYPQWIKELKEGRNPFDEATLKDLRNRRRIF